MQWLATPTYLCRRWLTFKVLGRLPIHGRFLEIGIGAGDFLYELAGRGFEGKGIDVSEDAVEYARRRVRPYSGSIEVAKQDFRELNETFGLILAFEVLEHFEGDGAALRKMYELLDKNGYLMLSVPARMKHWGPNDDWAGHVRRYERDELKTKAEEQGFSTVAVYSLGFPIANITKPFYDRIILRQIRRETNLDSAHRSKQSWKVPLSGSLYPFLSLIFNRFTVFPFSLLQCLFLRADVGTGYLAVFKKE